MSKKIAGNALPAYAVSQNFLTSSRTIDGLLRLTTITRADHVWEIGAGKGHITRRLLSRAGRVTAVEIDPTLQRRLAESIGDVEGFCLIRGDFLSVRLPASEPYKIFANIPFSITSAILGKLTSARNPPQDSWLIMERGAAKRFAGLPGPTLHSLALSPFFEVGIVGHVRREEFHPMPSVPVAMLHLHKKACPDIAPAQQGHFTTFLRSMRENPPGNSRCPLSKRQIAAALRVAGYRDIPQSATMDYVQWLCLFRCWLRLGARQ